MDVAILCRRIAPVHKSLNATTEGVVDPSADCHTFPGDKFPVGPGRALAADLLLQIDSGQGPNPEPITARAEVIHPSAFNDVLGDL